MTTYAVALTPDTTEILYMDYHVEKDGVEIDSGYGIPAEEIPGTNGRDLQRLGLHIPFR